MEPNKVLSKNNVPYKPTGLGRLFWLAAKKASLLIIFCHLYPSISYSEELIRRQEGDFLNQTAFVVEPLGLQMVKVYDGFYLGRYEVTQKQWLGIMGDNPSMFNGCDYCPVEQVSLDDVEQFIKKLNRMTDMSFRLPTKDEWLFARGPVPDNLDAVSWHTGNANNMTHPVGTKSPNGLGLYDMFGNVHEWTGSCGYESSLNPEECSKNVFIGGSFFDPVEHVSLSDNLPGIDSWGRGDNLGFRLLLQTKP